MIDHPLWRLTYNEDVIEHDKGRLDLTIKLAVLSKDQLLREIRATSRETAQNLGLSRRVRSAFVS